MVEIGPKLQGYPFVPGLEVKAFRPDEKEGAGSLPLPHRADLVISEQEMEAARLTPRCIVENYLFCDFAQLVAAGGTGKTTLILFEAIHIVLGRPLWGLEIRSTGWILLVTAEDQRERLVARLREMMEAMELGEAERKVVRDRIAIWDVSGAALKLARMNDGNIDLTPEVDRICAAYQADPPILAIFDPLVSFGASEQAINDNEQALVTAARRLINALGCCVRYVHHTGKQGRGVETVDQIDQYFGRGGSALADGTRMTTVLAAIKADSAPASLSVSSGEELVVMVRAKLSYAPRQPNIWLRRRGFIFDFQVEVRKTAREELDERKTRLLAFLEEGLAATPPRRLTRREIEEGFIRGLELTRAQYREAIAQLTAENKIVEMPLPKGDQKGGRKTFIAPVSSAQYPDKWTAEPPL